MSDQSSTRMKAVVVRHSGGSEGLEIRSVPKPVPAPDELLVRVCAAAVNRADLMQREGKYPPPPGASEILGLDIAGIVEDVGNECSNWRIGDRIFGLLAGGGYAQYCVIHRDMAMRVPSVLDLEGASAVPEVFLTAYQALHYYGRVASGDRVLIHAGASGVGTAAIQLASVAGAQVFATASAGKLALCRELGVDLAIDYRSEDFEQRIAEVTGGRGTNIIVDFIGGPYFAKNLAALALDGRLVLLATLGGAVTREVDLRELYRKRANIHGSTLRSRSLDYRTRLTQDFAAYALTLFEQGRLRPVVDRVFDWTRVGEAHRYMADNRNAGKLVLRISEC